MSFYREANPMAQHGFNCHCCGKLVMCGAFYIRVTYANEYNYLGDWKLCPSCAGLLHKIKADDEYKNDYPEGISLDDLRDAWKWGQDRKEKRGKK
ncbi:MAG: hypothetical protein A2020_16495 [Lentisphaerae bacterium GWF2_45_14]|nr:MAG: hypothetical protein A2020_16495 [Lentisphaerae bacterium GWF2_45_14]